MGIGEKKCLSYPKESLRMGTERKWIEIPKRKGKWTGNLLLENEIGKI